MLKNVTTGNATANECADYCIFLFSDMSKKITMQNLFMMVDSPIPEYQKK